MATATLLGLTVTLTPPALTALRIAPLLSSTASLTHAYMEWLTNSSFLVPAPVESRLSLSIRGVSTAPQKPNTPAEDADGKRREELVTAKQLVTPEWFTNFFNTGVLSVVGLNTLTLLSAGCNLALPQGLGAGERFYQLGLVAAVAHYAFVPLVGRSVRALIGLAAARAGKGEAASQEKAVDLVREWVGYHKIRMCSVDVLAWGCFLWGGVHALTAQA